MHSSISPDALIAALESSLDGWGTWLVIATIVVIVGLIVEYVPEVFERPRGPVWRQRLTKVGAVLVVLGVAGEGVAEWQALRTEGRLREIVHQRDIKSAERIRGLEKEAAQALRDAGNANERAAKAEKAAEEEKLARLKFEKEYGPRDLTGPQRDELIKLWHKYAGRVVKIERLDDPETIYFTSELMGVLGKAGLWP